MNRIVFRTICLMTASFGSMSAQAASYLVQTNAASGTIQTPGPTDFKTDTRSEPFALSSTSNTDSSSTDQAIATARASAAAAPGSVKGAALATGESFKPECCTSTSATGSTFAEVNDAFVLSSPQYANGTVASISAAILIDGVMRNANLGRFWRGSQSWRATARIGNEFWVWEAENGGDATSGIISSADAFGLKPLTANVTIGAQTPVMLRLETFARASTGGFGSDTALWETDLGSTMTWRGISGMTVGGQQVSDFSAFSSSSGFDYRKGIVDAVPPTPAIPEPQSWALLLAGFGVLGAAVRRRPPIRQVPA